MSCRRRMLVGTGYATVDTMLTRAYACCCRSMYTPFCALFCSRLSVLAGTSSGLEAPAAVRTAAELCAVVTNPPVEARSVGRAMDSAQAESASASWASACAALRAAGSPRRLIRMCFRANSASFSAHATHLATVKSAGLLANVHSTQAEIGADHCCTLLGAPSTCRASMWYPYTRTATSRSSASATSTCTCSML